ncbi:hypothetical protein BDV39DRAFT_210597 [Aspergillus sergii]|uniref:Uncharacterized protein n=1 Tax=Aspergillus sergii TaxID=1034303 RepID=A0A5N6WL62_9EURO|nr:hypothetical protein BDV39DRAFT_210597 [Aspergillus sergii]
MDDINEEVLKAIAEQHMVRIVVDVPTNLLRPDEYLASASELVSPFMAHWETVNTPRLLVVDVYPKHAYIVIDINNRRYNYDTAHQQIYAIPVYILQLSKKTLEWRFFRRAVDELIARTIAELHRLNGQNPIPFFADHINGPQGSPCTPEAYHLMALTVITCAEHLLGDGVAPGMQTVSLILRAMFIVKLRLSPRSTRAASWQAGHQPSLDKNAPHGEIMHGQADARAA